MLKLSFAMFLVEFYQKFWGIFIYMYDVKDRLTCHHIELNIRKFGKT